MTNEDSKEVHRSLRRGAGILKYVHEEWVNKLIEAPGVGSDSDPRVQSAYLNQTTGEAQEGLIMLILQAFYKKSNHNCCPCKLQHNANFIFK